MDILKIAVLGIAGMLLGILLKDQKKNMSCSSPWGCLCVFFILLCPSLNWCCR